MADAAREKPIMEGDELKEARKAGGVKGGRGNKREGNLPSVRSKVSGGENRAYLTRRLARDRPDLLAAWEAWAKRATPGLE